MGNAYASPSEEFWHACDDPDEQKALSFIETKMPFDPIDVANLVNYKKKGMTPLLLATKRGHLVLVKRLLELGAVPQDVDDEAGMGPVLFAAKEGRKELIKYFMTLEWGVNAMETRDNRDKATPLFWAARWGHSDVVAALIDGNEPKDESSAPTSSSSSSSPITKVGFSFKGANPNEIGSLLSKTSALFIASQYGHFDVVRTLVERKANIEFVWQSGATPLFIASQNGHKPVVAYLLAHGANVNKPRLDGAVPVTSATFGGHHDIVAMLIARGADVNIRNKSAPLGPTNGDSALITAVALGLEDIVELLLLAGADDSIVLPSKYTAYTIAVEKKQSAILDILHYYRLGRVVGIFKPIQFFVHEGPSQTQTPIPDLPNVSQETLKKTIATGERAFIELVQRRNNNIAFIEKMNQSIQDMITKYQIK